MAMVDMGRGASDKILDSGADLDHDWMRMPATISFGNLSKFLGTASYNIAQTVLHACVGARSRGF